VKLNDTVNEYGGNDEIRGKDIKNQLQQPTAQRDILTN